MNPQTEETLREIATKISEGRVLLVLGAGASMAAKCPPTSEIISSIMNKFTKARYSNNTSFVEVCQSVLDCQSYSRADLSDHIKQILDKLQPSEWHFELTKYPWSASGL